MKTVTLSRATWRRLAAEARRRGISICGLIDDFAQQFVPLTRIKQPTTTSVILSLLRQHSEGLTIRELMAETGLKYNTLYVCCAGLLRERLLTRQQAAPSGRSGPSSHVWRLE